jgi:hypothetical protein
VIAFVIVTTLVFVIASLTVLTGHTGHKGPPVTTHRSGI